MKECPLCHTVYDDGLRFCIKDGHALTDKPDEAAEPARPDTGNTVQSEQKPKNRGCLKKIIIGAAVILGGLVMLYHHLQNAATYLRTEPNDLRASKAGGLCTVDIDYDGYFWTVNHKPDWVTIVESDKDFMVSVGTNSTGQSREGTITVQSGKQLAHVTVRQNAYATYVRAAEASVKFGKDGGTKDIAIETDGCSWEADYTNWMTVTKSEHAVHVKCPVNSGDYRTGTINVKEDNVRFMIMVTQGGKCYNCHGSGEIMCNACFGTGGMGFGMYYSGCMMCGGRGKISCNLCKGSGYIE